MKIFTFFTFKKNSFLGNYLRKYGTSLIVALASMPELPELPDRYVNRWSRLLGLVLLEVCCSCFYSKVACNSIIVTKLLRLYFVPNPAIEAMCQKAEPSNKLPNDIWPYVPIVSKSGLVLHSYGKFTTPLRK